MNRLSSIRRWGVVTLTGVTLFGGLSLIGAGVASAATAPTVTAALTTGQTVTSISGTATGAAGGGLTLTVAGTPLASDTITLTLACPSTGTAVFVSTADTSADFGTGIVSHNAANCSTITYTASAGQAANPTLVLTPTFTTSGVTTQALSISGSYATNGLAATSFAVPTDANVAYFEVTSNVPAVTLPPSGTTGISPITIYDPTNILAGTATGNATVAPNPAAGGANASISEGTVANAAIGATYAPVTFTVTQGTTPTTTSSWAPTGLPVGMTLTPASGNVTAVLAGNPTTAGSYNVVITANEANSTTATATFTLVVAPAHLVLTLSAGTWSGTPTVSTVGFTVTAPTAQAGSANLTLTVTQVTPASGQSLTINNASVVTVGVGPSTVSVTIAQNAVGGTLVAKITVGTILGSVTTIYGADGTADGTVAAEFDNAFPNGNANVVLATDIAHTNGSDALAASYLEGTLGTGLLITTPTTLGADAQAAIQREGVSTVYVVGGPLAITPAVISQIEALPVYNAGGLTLAGGNVKVVGPIYGATATDTAAAIDNYFGTAFGASSFTGAYANNVGSTSPGLYNDTTGSASTIAPSGLVPTAVVMASSDWQDSMSFAPEAYRLHLPVILTDASSTTQTLGADATNTLTKLGVKQVIIVGGQLAVSNTVEAAIAAMGISVLRIAGIDATDTAAQLANFALATGNAGLGWSASSKNTVIASHGNYWSDALGAAALGGGANMTTFGLEPIILVENPTTVGSYTTAELSVLAAAPSNTTNLTVLGGPLAMPTSTVNTLLQGL